MQVATHHVLTNTDHYIDVIRTALSDRDFFAWDAPEQLFQRGAEMAESAWLRFLHRQDEFWTQRRTEFLNVYLSAYVSVQAFTQMAQQGPLGHVLAPTTLQRGLRARVLRALRAAEPSVRLSATQRRWHNLVNETALAVGTVLGAESAIRHNIYLTSIGGLIQTAGHLDGAPVVVNLRWRALPGTPTSVIYPHDGDLALYVPRAGTLSATTRRGREQSLPANSTGE